MVHARLCYETRTVPVILEVFLKDCVLSYFHGDG